MHTSCKSDDDIIFYDILPITVEMDVCDKSGNTLLNPDATGSIVGEEMTIEYNGETYPIRWQTDNAAPSRALPATFTGMWHHRKDNSQPAFNPKNWTITIGEFPGEDTKEHALKINFRGKTHTLHINNRWYGLDDRRNRTEIYFDGAKVTSQPFTLVVE